MISSIFGKTKPINFVFIVGYLFVFFILSVFNTLDTPITFSIMTYHGISWVILIVSIFIIDFIVKKNHLSKNNSYIILVFALLLTLSPESFFDRQIILSNGFLLLAIRRIISLRSYVATKRKIFDATLWVIIASLFYEPAILGLLWVFVGLIVYVGKDVKNWFIPLLVVGMVLIFGYTYAILKSDITIFKEIISIDLSYIPKEFYQSINTFSFWIVGGIGIISLLSFFIQIKAKTSEARTAIALIIGLLFTTLAMNVALPEYNKAAWLFVAFPLALLIANYIETRSKKWVEEITLWLFLVAPFVELML
ncbi:DUF6427 family protein [Leptobacterium sp. I13]|uniref:DUF6427 family protein n=1 Tax=Leptobacterium meishanense TaxID=3128904 RepID=UPI0030ED89D1